MIVVVNAGNIANSGVSVGFTLGLLVVVLTFACVVRVGFRGIRDPAANWLARIAILIFLGLWACHLLDGLLRNL